MFYSPHAWVDSPSGPKHIQCWGAEIILRRTLLSRTPLDEWSTRRSDLYLTTHNTHKRQTPAGAGGIRTLNRRNQAARTHALDGTASGSAIKYVT